MNLRIFTLIMLFFLITNLIAEETLKRESQDRKFYAHGPRLGITLLYNRNENTVGISKDASFILTEDIPPVITQFGYHYDLSLYMSNNMNPLVQFDGFIGGVENGLFLPSLSMVIGCRIMDIFEIGVGPNISLAGTAFVIAGGVNFKNENIYFPVNIAIVHAEGRYRISLITGFNTP